MAPRQEMVSSRILRSGARKNYTEDLMDVDPPDHSSGQDGEFKCQVSDVDNADDEQDEQQHDKDHGNLGESEDETLPAKRAKTRHLKSDYKLNTEAKKAIAKEPRAPPKSTAPSKPRAMRESKKSVPGVEEEESNSFADPAKNFNFENILDYGSRPLITTPEVFEDLTMQIYEKFGPALLEFCKTFSEKPLNVLTFCSGTESPILSMQMIQKILVAKYSENFKFLFEHEGSAEIHPAKAAYIQKNFQSKRIFRDIIELILPKENPTPRLLTTMYGGKTEVPENIDILIAGFACDDFSLLNNVRKTLEQKGESGDTFFAVKAYMNDYKPKLVILENVITAEWVPKFDKEGKRKYNKKNGHIQDKSIEEHLRKIGYKTIFFRLDTKEHYLPHTRLRGYMVCVLETSIPKGADWTTLMNECRNVVNSLKRDASAPVEAMMFPSDHPSLKVLLGDRKGDQKPYNWDKCFINHLDYALKLGIGDKKPITNWKPDGSRELLDHYIPMPNMTDRVADSLDIAHKRNLVRGFDDRYLNRNLELSQNVYRYFDNSRHGIQQCLTPNNIAFSTFQGRRITGAEAARLQGIDLDQVDTTNMSESLLLDMCGNAMTSTVVGTVIFAVLLTFRGMFDVKGRKAASVKSEHTPHHLGEESLHRVESKPSQYTPVSVGEITALAKLTRRLCLCEGRYDHFLKPFQRCKLCWHTTCITCGKQPKHEYEPFQMEFINERKNPIDFDDKIKKSIPMEIDLSALYSGAVEAFLKSVAENAISEGFVSNTLSQVLEAYKKVLQSRVYFRSVRRAEDWHIRYDSPEAVLKLTISDNGVQWQLYANVDKEPIGSDMSRYLRQYPIARMTPKGDDIMRGSWGYWMPIKKVFKARVTSSGPLIPTYKNSCGLVGSINQFNHSYVHLRLERDDNYDPKYFPNSIEGRYCAVPICGQPFSTLHLLDTRQPDEKAFGLFFHHEMQSGNPSSQSFVLGSDFERKDWGEEPAVAGQFSASWRQPVVHGEDPGSSVVYVKGTDATVDAYSDDKEEQVDITVHGRFVELGAHSIILSGPSFIYGHLPIDISHLDLSCGNEAAVFTCKGKINYKISFLLPKNKWTRIDRTNRATFWPEFSWAVQQAQKIEGHLEVNTNWHSWTDLLNECLKCGPTVPTLLWTLNRKGKRIPYEDPEEASEWEQSMKCRPSPMNLLFRVSDHGNITLQISMNPVTLMHQAKARLLISDCASKVNLTWRLVTDDGRKQHPENNPLTLLNNDKVEMASQPFSHHTLRDEQLRVLTWLLEKEVKGTTFAEEEVVESLIRDIGYRAEGRATRDILQRGGILAQDVGFGKTVVMLALIKKRHNFYKSKADNIGDLPGRIYAPATLIMMPSHLVKQWKGEVAKFTPELKKGVIVLEEWRDFMKLSIKQVREAEIVIVNWGACIKAAYIKMLANLAGIVEPADKPSVREFRAWYKTAISGIEDSVDELRRDPEGFLAYVESKWRTSMEEASSVDVRVPSKHVTGAAYVNSDMRQSSQSQDGESDPGLKRKRTAKKPKCAEEFKHSIEFPDPDEYTSMIHALIEIFHWARIIIDEHTYGDGMAGTILANLKADNYFMLSGTPALGSHSDVKTLATLFGVNLGVDDFIALRSDIFKQKTTDLTKSELFMVYQESPSPAYRERRHKHAQMFLDAFCRKDVANVDHIKCTTHYCLVDQSPSEKAIYLELVQHLAATEFQIVRSNSIKGDRAKQICDVASGHGDGKPALFMRASHFTVDNYEGADTTGLCDAIVQSRKAEFESFMTAEDDGFKGRIKRIYWLHVQVEMDREDGKPPCTDFIRFREKIDKNEFGDLDTTNELSEAITNAVQSYSEDDWEIFYRPVGMKLDEVPKPLPAYPTGQNTTFGVSHITRMAFELRTWTAKIVQHVMLLVKQKRSLRFIENVREVQRSDALTCSHCAITNLQPADVKVMVQCGHLLATACCSGNDCPVSGCKAFNREYQKMPGSEFGKSQFDSCTLHGSKIDAVVKLLLEITKVKDEKALVFVQYEQSTNKLEEALETYRIDYSDLRKETTSSNVLEAFQTGEPCGREKPSEVLILNIGDANASGSNLTTANHVIFLQPYYTSGENAQQAYEAAMTQAIGRARRHGQTKEVHVYHFLTTQTIDVDYFEARTNTILNRQGKSDEEKTRGFVTKASLNWKTELGTYFASSMKFEGAIRNDHTARH